MSPALLPTRAIKSTNVRLKLRFAMMKLANRAGALFPARAARRFADVMLVPQRPRDPHASDLLRADNATRIPYGDRWLRRWSFGEGPAVLLVHGWAGRAAQFEAWIEPVVAAGYRAVLFDAPAHGHSNGRRTNLMDMAGAIQHVAGLAGPLHAIVAHSFGAPATLFALRHGLACARIALLAAPVSLTDHSIALARMLGFAPAVRARMQRDWERRLDFAWADAESDTMLAALTAVGPLATLLVHDRRDREVPYAAAERIKAAVPAARLFTTDGNGHNRLLSSPPVIHETLGFIGGGRSRATARQAA